jgi:DNA-binding transcriptional ArsR family regulator
MGTMTSPDAAPAGSAAAPDRKGPRRAATEDEARALASAVRLRILRLCLDRPLTNKEIAARLGANAATTLHHVRKLVATGFLAAQEERRGARGAREVPYLATGKSWRLDVHDVPVEGSLQAMIDAFLDEISFVDLDARPTDDLIGEAGLTRLGLRLPRDVVMQMIDRIGEILQEYAIMPPDHENGVPFSVFLALYRDVTRDARPARRARDRRSA